MSRVEEIERAIDKLGDEEFVRVAEHVRTLEQERMTSLRAEIHAGFEAIERGEYEDHDDASTKSLADDIKRRGRARLEPESSA